MRDKSSKSMDRANLEIEELVLEVMDYLVQGSKMRTKVDAVFDGNSDYMTNPLLIACKLEKYHLIMDLLKYFKTERMLRKLMLVNDDDKLSGDECLMILYRNVYYKYIVNNLQVLDENGLKTLILHLLHVKNRYNMEHY